MGIKLRRALNAFILGTLATGLALLIEDYENISASVRVGDWSSAQTLLLAVIGGAIGAGLRALQSSTPLPSPEPEENQPAPPPEAP